MIDDDGKLVIEANGNGNTFCAVFIPRIIGGYPHIKRSDFDTRGLSNSDEIKEAIISAITTQKGKNNENMVILDEE